MHEYENITTPALIARWARIDVELRELLDLPAGETDPAARTMELLAEQDASEHELGGRGEGEVPPTVQYRAQIGLHAWRQRRAEVLPPVRIKNLRKLTDGA